MSRTSHGDMTIAGEAGAKIINDTSLHTISASMIEFSSDAIITVLTIEGSATNVVSTYVSTPASAVGAHSISAEGVKSITSIQLSAGTCAYAI